ncbi:hypothetical protein GQ53DRAFT_837208 [Thozetella sp. PMI_491]|nr:hypothetical protein GQ53DRAFT_837208 [Thozetella sp. PMI_491]
MDLAPRLVCQQCKRRKTKCDKDSPCGACRAAGLNCRAVQRARLPRGRSGKARGKNEVLEARISKIEELMSRHQEAQETLARATTGDQDPARPSARIGEFVAPDFWASLSDEVHGLREALESSDDENEAAGPPVAAEQPRRAPTGPGSIIFHQNCPYDHTSMIPIPKADQRSVLRGLYRERVDQLYKIVHWPTTRAALEAIYADPQRSTPSQSEKALEYSIYYIALCTIKDDSEAKSLGFEGRRSLVQQYRAATEVLLARTSLLILPDIAALQALVIYMLAIRTEKNDGLVWAMAGVAVRAAQSMRLGEEKPDEYSRFELELRRRLLYAIGVIDSYSSMDRGTVPLMPSSAFHTPPLEIDDDELTPEHVRETSKSEFTDMSFSSMLYGSMVRSRKAYELCQAPRNGWADWPKRLEMVASWEQWVQKKYGAINDSSSPVLRFQLHMAGLVTASLSFMLRRPPSRQPCDAVPPWDDFDVMGAAASILRLNLLITTHPDFAPWSWKFCVPWTPQAILLVELSTRPWGPASDAAYLVAIESYRQLAPHITDSQSGMLWRPIMKLMRRAEKAKKMAMSQRVARVMNYSMPSFADREGPDTFSATIPGGTREPEPLMGQLPGLDVFVATGAAPTATGYEELQQLSGLNLDVDMSWMHWDLFLQDAESFTNNL